MENKKYSNFVEEFKDIKSYHDFSDGGNVEDSEFQEWIQESLNKCINESKGKNLKKNFTSISTGNSKLFIEVYRQEDYSFTVHVSICKGYLNKFSCGIIGL